MNTWLISDTHFGHSNILKFKDYNGNYLRQFYNVDHMDETMIENWNKVVKPDDKVYHLGDVAICKPSDFHRIMRRLNGRKVLIKGNHDTMKLSVYAEYFKDIRGYHVLDNILLAHIPVHPESVVRFRGQLHGHLHKNSLYDPRYKNVSVEVIGFTPVNFEELRELWKR